jgi:phosphate-selective porin OprO and OprP
MSRLLITSLTFTGFALARSLCAQTEPGPSASITGSVPSAAETKPAEGSSSEPRPETQPNSLPMSAPLEQAALLEQAAPREASLGPIQPEPEPGTAGVYQGVFFVRDRKDVLRLYVQGRAMIDFYSFYGPGVTHVASLNPTFLLRKVRLEVGGELYRKVQWFFGGDFGMNSTSVGANQSVVVRAAPADVYINYKAHPLLNVEVGQFDLPFTAETRTSDKFLPFMERSVPVRVIGKGNAKDTGLMLWGNLDQRRFAYAASLVQGDGMNRPNVDRRFDLVARAYVRPFAGGRLAIRDLQLGASVRRGSRDQHLVSYDYPAMTTAGGYAFWKPTYGAATSASNPSGQTHVIPSGAQTLVAAELRVPTDSFDFIFEGLYGHENMREAQDVNLSQSLRLGTLASFGYYAQVGWWPFGNAYVNGAPGDQGVTSVDFSKPDKPTLAALQLLLKWEQLSANYQGNKRGGSSPSDIEGKIRINALSFGATYWLGKILRFSANYGINWFPGSAPSSATPGQDNAPVWSEKQRAQAPGNTLGLGVDDSARDRAHVLHELLFRAQVAF